MSSTSALQVTKVKRMTEVHNFYTKRHVVWVSLRAECVGENISNGYANPRPSNDITGSVGKTVSVSDIPCPLRKVQFAPKPM